jgi:hypothetical protein
MSKSIQDIALSTAQIATETKALREDYVKADKRIEELESKPIKRYDTFVTDLTDDRNFKVSIIACALVALAAMKDHDEYSLDFASGRAVSKAEEILTELENDDYDEGLSDIVDNAVDMYNFVYTYFIEE